jgi:tight adherence protein C
MNLILIALILALAATSYRLLLGASIRRRSAELIYVSTQTEPAALGLDEAEDGFLVRWLSRAGFRSPSAVSVFFAATAASTALGLLIAFLMVRLGLVRQMVTVLAGIPGGVGDALGLAAMGGPYIVLATLIPAPVLIVRAARRARVEAIEQDLAPTLELLATLAEAGLGFDGALARILESESADRPLNQEFRIYQRDTLGGIARLESLRRFGHRIGLTSVSIFVSAMIQTEQVGASLSETLRTQADDLRDRRKMRALLLAQALPVKLVFPLIFCFLPGIFYSTLGPVIAQFVNIVDSVLRR